LYKNRKKTAQNEKQYTKNKKNTETQNTQTRKKNTKQKQTKIILKSVSRVTGVTNRST
jgi:hypothetical protein